MTPEQEQSMKGALTEFVGKAEEKYRAGQAEHSGNLWEKDGLLEEAGKEVIDQMFYIAALRQRLSHIDYKVRNLEGMIEAAHLHAHQGQRNMFAAHLREISEDLNSL